MFDGSSPKRHRSRPTSFSASPIFYGRAVRRDVSVGAAPADKSPGLRRGPGPSRCHHHRHCPAYRPVPTLSAESLGASQRVAAGRSRLLASSPRRGDGGSVITAQMVPVGTPPSVAELLVAALLYSTPAEACAVLAHVSDDDIDWPLVPVLSAVRRLSAAGVPPSPQLVADQLRREGKLDRQVGVALASATTAGACGSAARHYAAAVVAERLRRLTESAGAALKSAAESSAEGDLAPLAARAAAQVSDCADRLAALRGGDL
jgi:hypothetical protein